MASHVLRPSRRLACVTMDLEEDLGSTPNALSYEVLAIFPSVVKKLAEAGVPLTVFVAGNLLERHGHVLASYSQIEFHSHGYRHPPHSEARKPDARRKNIVDGLQAFERHFGRPAVGYRAPYGFLERSDFPWLVERGVRFDSSFFPGAHVSGFHYFRTSQPDQKDGLVEVPISGVPLLRIPYSVSYMRLLGSAPFRWGVSNAFRPSPLIFDFHLHDLVMTSALSRLSGVWKTIYGAPQWPESWRSVASFIDAARGQGYDFVTMNRLVDDLTSTGV